MTQLQDRSRLDTERRLEASMQLDSMSIERAVAIMNEQDRVAVDAVAAVAGEVAAAVRLVADAFAAGGRLLYVGAGTSGRLGVLDASECPPTFRSEPEMVHGIIAGGDAAMFRAQEGAEDNDAAGAAEIDARGVCQRDVVCGIAAGGTTPFVHGALARARQRGAKTLFLTCVDGIVNEPVVDVVIRPLTGPEVLTGSTRLKAGTATKLILNQITTLAMVQMGKTYENLMVDLRASNSKLRDRAARTIMMIAGVDRTSAEHLLEQAEGHVKVALVMHAQRVDAPKARRLLETTHGHLRPLLET